MAATQEPTSYFSMPGSFHSEGVHPGLIRPPASPAATSPIFASAIFTPASPSTPSALPRPKYKRRRPVQDSSSTNNSNWETKEAASTGHGTAPDRRWNAPIGASRNDASHTARSYVLAGNLDTPGAVNGHGGVAGPEGPSDHGLLGESMFSDSDYRTVLGSKRRREDVEPDHTAPSTLYTLPTHPPEKAPSWGSFAFNTLGGVVGKVWDFCWGSSFKGFHAGAGRGYDAPHVIAHEEADSPVRDLPGAWNLEEDGLDAEPINTGAHRPFQGDGHVRAEDYNPSTSFSRASTPTRQPAKRRQTDKADELGRNWVVINQHDAGRASPATARPSMARTTSSARPRAIGSTPSSRRVTSASMSRASASAQSGSQTPTSRISVRRSVSRGGRHSIASNAWEKPPVASTASYASPRSSPAGTPRESTFRDSHGASTPTRRRTTAIANPPSGVGVPESRVSRPGHRRSHSNASAAATRSLQGPEASIPKRQSPKQVVENGGEDDMRKQSPRLTEEARRLAAKRRMEERDADVRIAAFNRRLQDMIRQGKEALGTTVDVEMEGPMDGAWEDDE